MARFGQPHPKKRGFFPNNRAGTRASRKVERAKPTTAKTKPKNRPRSDHAEPSRLGNMKVIEVVDGDALATMLGAISGDAAIAT